jgi:hypothetical protein
LEVEELVYLVQEAHLVRTLEYMLHRHFQPFGAQVVEQVEVRLL